MTWEEFWALPIEPDIGAFPPPALCVEGGAFGRDSNGDLWEAIYPEGRASSPPTGRRLASH